MTDQNPNTVPTEAERRAALDFVPPTWAGRALRVTDAELLAMVNDGTLAAYRFGSAIRFRRSDVARLAVMAAEPRAAAA